MIYSPTITIQMNHLTYPSFFLKKIFPAFFFVWDLFQWHVFLVFATEAFQASSWAMGRFLSLG